MTIETRNAQSAKEAVEILNSLNFRQVNFEFHGENYSNDYEIAYRHFDGVTADGKGTCFGLIEIVIGGKLDTVRFINTYRETAVDIKIGNANYTVDNKGDVELIDSATEEEPEMKNQNTNAVSTPATIETKIAKNGAAIETKIINGRISRCIGGKQVGSTKAFEAAYYLRNEKAITVFTPFGDCHSVMRPILTIKTTHDRYNGRGFNVFMSVLGSQQIIFTTRNNERAKEVVAAIENAFFAGVEMVEINADASVVILDKDTEISEADVEDYIVKVAAQDVATEAELDNAFNAKPVIERYKVACRSITHTIDKRGRHMWIGAFGLLSKKDVSAWLSNYGLTVEQFLDAEAQYKIEVEQKRAEFVAKCKRGNRIARELTKKLSVYEPTVEVTYDINEQDEDTYYLECAGINYKQFATAAEVEDFFHVLKPDVEDYAVSIEAQDAAIDAETKLATNTATEIDEDEAAEKFYRETAATYRKMQSAIAPVREFLFNHIFDIYHFDYVLKVNDQNGKLQASPNKFHLVDYRFDAEVDRDNLEYVIYFWRTPLARYRKIDDVTHAVDMLAIAIANREPEFTFPPATPDEITPVDAAIEILDDDIAEYQAKFDAAVDESREDYCSTLKINGETLSFHEGELAAVLMPEFDAEIRLSGGKIRQYRYREAIQSKAEFFKRLDELVDIRAQIAAVEDFKRTHGACTITAHCDFRAPFVAIIHAVIKSGEQSREKHFAGDFATFAGAKKFVDDFKAVAGEMTFTAAIKRDNTDGEECYKRGFNGEEILTVDAPEPQDAEPEEYAVTIEAQDAAIETELEFASLAEPETKETLRKKAAKLVDLKERLDKEKSFAECARDKLELGQMWMRAAAETSDSAEFYTEQIATTGAAVKKLNERIAELAAQITTVENELETVNKKITASKKAA